MPRVVKILFVLLFFVLGIPGYFRAAVGDSEGKSNRNEIPRLSGMAVVSPKSEVSVQIKKLWKDIVGMKPPVTFPAEGLAIPGLTGVFYRGMPFNGKETRVFAWIGFPENSSGKKVPAMVLVHGAEGTAHEGWVRFWNSRGYAAISMDISGHVPVLENDTKDVHPFSGPTRLGGFGHVDEKIEDQWTFHAVADVILANTLLRSLPGVDTERIGITGISWGGYISIIAASVDSRYKCCIPVYGCGYFGEESKWTNKLKTMGKSGDKWLSMWDASLYLEDMDVPCLWVSDTNDPYFSFLSLQKSALLPGSEQQLCVEIMRGHTMDIGIKVPETVAFADCFLKGETPLPEITGMGIDKDKNEAWVTFKSKSAVTSAVLNYTRETGLWEKRIWRTTKAVVDTAANKVTAKIPKTAAVYYIGITDERALMVSSPFVIPEIKPEVRETKPSNTSAENEGKGEPDSPKKKMKKMIHWKNRG